MIQTINASNLGMALRCGEQFRRRYIEGEIIPPGISLGRGRGVHKANEINLRQKIISKTDAPLSDLQDAARDAYVNTFSEGVFLTKEEIPAKNKLLNEGLNDTIVLTGLYHGEVAPEIMPVDVERKFSYDIGLPLRVTGYIDIEETNKIDDLKTATRAWPDGKIKTEMQPVFYTMAHVIERKKRPLFRYHILRSLKRGPARQVQEHMVYDKQFHALFAKMEMFCEMLKSGVFMPADPGGWMCSEKYCGYYLTCKYVGNVPARKWI